MSTSPATTAAIPKAKAAQRIVRVMRRFFSSRSRVRTFSSRRSFLRSALVNGAPDSSGITCSVNAPHLFKQALYLLTDLGAVHRSALVQLNHAIGGDKQCLRNG